MRKRTRLFWLVSGVLLFGPRMAQADTNKICGPITATLTIFENSELVCDVMCSQTGGPCIQFGADHIWLRLNGFTMTRADTEPPTNCVDRTTFPLEDGISTNGHDHVQILGPGMVQRFRRHGLFVINSSRVTVKHVTSHHNCFSGLQTASMTDSDIEENVLIRNAIASGPFSCGGNCNLNAQNNRIRRNEAAGNGSIEPGATPRGPMPNDFGISLLGTSSGNVVEENGVGGNINGIWLAPLTAGNLIRRNVIAGNPPVQISPTSTPIVGVDIRDFSAPGANTFEENLCITYDGPTVPPPCPNFPKFAGHRNTSQGSSMKSP
jgi:hypothetical protein